MEPGKRVPPEPRPFLSKAWSGSSMQEGVRNMFAAMVKREPPDELDELEKHVEDRFWCKYTLHSLTSTYILAGSTETTGHELHGSRPRTARQELGLGLPGAVSSLADKACCTW